MVFKLIISVFVESDCVVVTHREAEPCWLMSSGETVQTEEGEQQTPSCALILHPDKRNVNRRPWRHTDQTQCSCFPSSSQRGSQKKPIQESVFAFPDPVLPESPETQKGHFLSVKNVSSVVPNNLNVSNTQNSMNKNIINGCIILCDDWEVFQDWRKFTGHQWTMDNMFVSTLKPSIIQKSLSPITEDAANGNLINLRSHLQICPNSNDPDESVEQDGNIKRKKSVSFDEDVTVYLFDQVLLILLHYEILVKNLLFTPVGGLLKVSFR